MLRKLLPMLALFAWAGAAHAGDKPLYVPPPAWVKPAPPIDATHLTDADPILLMIDQQQQLKDGEAWMYFDAATRIASPQVLTSAGTLPIPWDPSKGDLMIHRVEIIRGTEHIDLIAAGARFNVLQREQQLEQATLNGMLTATLAVEGLRVGDVLHATFSMTRKDPALHGNVQTVAPLVADPMRLQFGRLRLIWPKAMNLHWRTYVPGAAPLLIDNADGSHELSVQFPVPKAADLPDDAPARFRPLPILEATTYADWTAVSKDVAPLFRTEGTIAPGGPIAAEVDRIAKATADPRTRAAMALQLVQDKVRYLFRGMDDGNYVPQAPALTWSVRYGDCKAKTLLLLAMLRALGIEAEPVLASIGLGDYVADRLPMPGAFNHVLVRATIDGKPLWLDGTGSGTRLADLDDVPPFRYGLPLREGGAGLLTIDMRPDARPDSDADVELDATAGINFPMPYKIRVTLRGQTADMLRVAASQSGKDQLNSMIDAVLNGYLGSSQPIDRSIKYDEESGTAIVTATGIVDSQWAKDNERYKVQLDSAVDGISFTPDRGRPAWRDLPVSTGNPDDRRVRTRIHLPGGGAGFTLEGDKTLPAKLGGALLSRSVSLEGGWLTVDDRITTGIGEVAPADIPATRAAVAQAKTRLLKAVAPADYPPRWKQIDAAKRAKAFDPILAVYARRIADKPDEAVSYTSRAAFLDGIYDRQGAIRDLDKAIAIAPDVDTYLWRARLYSAINDDTHAMADVNAALAIDPSSTAAIGQLAALQADHGKRDEAVSMLAEHAAEAGKEKPTYVEAQAELLGDGGKVDEALTLLDGTIATTPGSPDLLNARCWMKGTHNVSLDTALKDCTKSIELSENPEAALDSRAMVYFRMNRFEDALEDLNAALERNPEQAASLYMRGVIRNRTAPRAGDDDIAAARMMFPRIDEQYGRYGIKP